MRRVFPYLLLVTACCRPQAEVTDPNAEPAPERWRQIRAEIRERFPEVRQLSTAEFAAADHQELLLIDVRASEEFEVSHIPLALNTPLGTDLREAMAEMPRDRRIVVYCSVGWRSSIAAEQLSALGFSSVENLEGSIFAWANEGRPLESDAGPALSVHPFDEDWGQLLRAELRATR